MKLIFIHGRAQEEFEELELKKTWIDTLNEGLKKSNLTLPTDVQIEFPYYGKLLKKLVDNLNNPSAAEEEVTRGFSQEAPSEFKQIEFFQEFLTEMAHKTDLTPDERAELLDNSEATRGFLNWEPVQKILALMDRRQSLGEKALKSFTLDVFLYLTVRDIRKQIDSHIIKCFDDEPCVVVGHSLGTIVSYLVLRNNPHFNVKKFITIGSPLGMSSIRKYLDLPLQMPASVKNGWFNAFDERDFVALNPLDAVHFNIDPTIENKYDIDNHTDNRHGITGYLNDALVAKKIHEALVM